MKGAMHVRKSLAAVSVGAIALAMAAAGCGSNNTGGGGGNKDTGKTSESAISTDPKDSLGPAKAPDGSVKGGNLTVLLVDDFEHLDPARSYVNIQQVSMGLVYRTLTAFKEAKDASGAVSSTLVGDLAETPGVDVNNDCKTWKFTLKKGVKYEDGTEVKAADVAYGIARSFSPDLPEGPHYIQQWLAGDADYNKTYKGPYNGGAALPPNLQVNGDYELVFNFNAPHCDMPFASSMPMTAPVPAAKDTKTDYDKRPFSSGPYKIKDYKKDVSLVLDRNPNWDTNSDALHTAAPDTITFAIGNEADAISNRLIADSGADQQALTWTNVVSELVPKTQDAAVQSRITSGPTQFTWRFDINTQRVTDLNVRKAIGTAVDKDAMLKPIGGSTAGTPTNEQLSPTVAGFKKFDVFGVPETGDPAKAKELLGGKEVPLVMAHANTTRRTAQAVAAKAFLEKAGFKVTLAPVDGASYYTEIGKKNNKYDIYLAGWGADWPSGSTVLPVLFGGDQIVPEGNYNTSYSNFPEINAEIARIGKLPAAEATAQWAALDEKIMKDFAPSIPLYTDRNYTLQGSKVGGTYLSLAFGVASLNTVFVKP
jgi:peptide/nickel transport system substrate-binding protein